MKSIEFLKAILIVILVIAIFPLSFSHYMVAILAFIAYDSFRELEFTIKKDKEK